MRTWLWWSTGKDSAWALHELRRDPSVTVERLVTTVGPSGHVAVHRTPPDVLHAQADLAGLPLTLVALPDPCPNAAYEAALAPALDLAAEEGVEAMAFGDLHLADIRAYREALLAGRPLRAVFPLWGRDTTALAGAMLDGGLKAVVTALDSGRVDRRWLGAPYDQAFLDELPDDVDPCGENGEFHTCVAAGPMFRGSLDLAVADGGTRQGMIHADVGIARP